MRILLFTVFSCKACDAHRRELMKLCKDRLISLNIYDIDDPRYLSANLAAMRKWNVQKTPSVIVLNVENTPILILQGVNHSIERLQKFLDETNSNLS